VLISSQLITPKMGQIVQNKIQSLKISHLRIYRQVPWLRCP
jgi:hypothetical protein